jgi:hypothetical protein
MVTHNQAGTPPKGSTENCRGRFATTGFGGQVVDKYGCLGFILLCSGRSKYSNCAVHCAVNLSIPSIEFIGAKMSSRVEDFLVDLLTRSSLTIGRC